MSRKTVLVLLIAGIAHTALAQTAEVCGNDIDDDGNGMTDENCAPTLSTGVCENPLSCGETGMVSWKTGALHYDLPPDISPRVPLGPSISFSRFYASMMSPGANPASVNKSPLGTHWGHTYLTYLDWYQVGGINRIVLHTSRGQDVFFTDTGTSTVIGSSTYYWYSPQAGYHVNKTADGKPFMARVDTSGVITYQEQLLTGETLVYNASGQLAEIWDTLKTPKKVLVTWTSTSNGNVSTVTDAVGRHRLNFVYTGDLLTSLQYQVRKTPTSSWTTYQTTTYAYTSGILTSVTAGSTLLHTNSYAGGYLTQIQDGSGNTIVTFTYDGTTAGKVDRVDTARGVVGFEYNTSRASCTGATVLYFNKGNTTSCNVDSDCGSGFLCGGKTGSGTTGTCFRAARCLALGTVNGESVVTTVSPLGPPGESCDGACTDVAQYVWSTSPTLLSVTGRQDPLGYYTSATYNSNGLPDQIAYGDTDSDPKNGGYTRVTYLFYDSTFQGRIAEVRRKSDLDPDAAMCAADNSKGCASTTYVYSTTDNQLSSVQRTGNTLDSSGNPTSLSYTTSYIRDIAGRVTEVDGPVPGAKTTYSYHIPSEDFDGDYLSLVKVYTDGTNYLSTMRANYGSWGLAQYRKDPDNTVTCFTYDPDLGYMTQQLEKMTTSGDCGTVDSVDLTTIWLRDSALRLTKLTRPDGSCLFYEYDTKGRLARTKRRDDCNAASSGDRQEYVYDAEGLLTEVDTYDASGTLTAKQPYTYFDSRRLQNIVNPADTSKFTGLVYDARGQITEIDGAGSLSKTTYNPIDHEGRVNGVNRYRDATNYDTWTLAYDWPGDQSSVTDGDSKATQSVRDDLGRAVKLVSPDMAHPTLRLHDAAGRVTTVVEDLGGTPKTHTFTFDLAGRPLNSDYAGGCLNQWGANTVETYRYYDALPSGLTCPMAGGCNNIAGRLAVVQQSLMCSSTYFSTDGSLDQLTFYSYDANGRVVEEYITDDTGRIADHLYSWTKNGALAQVTTPSSAVIGWTYGSAGNNSDTDLITSMSRTSTPIIENIIWNPYGPLEQYDQENTISAIKLQTTLARNLAYRITSTNVHIIGSTTQHAVTVTEDAKGRVTSRDYYPSDPQISGLFDSYFLYDEQDRVLCETTNSVSTCPTSGSNIKHNHSLSPPFTHAGDWKRVLRPIAGSTNGLINDFNSSGTTYGSSHEVTDVNQFDGSPAFGHTAIGYDSLGNRSYDDNTTSLTNDRRDYTYDQRHNLTTIRGQYYTAGAWHYYDVVSTFDHKNRRVSKSFYDETTTKTAQWFFYYDALDRLTEVRYTPDTSASSTYSLFQLFWLGDRLVLYWQTDYPAAITSRRYTATDETGRPIYMMSWPSSGNSSRVWAINPNAWASNEAVLVGASLYQPILFAGQYQDVETAALENDGATIHRPGLSLNGFRTYDPYVGSYLQYDPKADQTWSSYLYAASDPVGRSDPTGDASIEVGAGGLWLCTDVPTDSGPIQDPETGEWLPGGEVIHTECNRIGIPDGPTIGGVGPPGGPPGPPGPTGPPGGDVSGGFGWWTCVAVPCMIRCSNGIWYLKDGKEGIDVGPVLGGPGEACDLAVEKCSTAGIQTCGPGSIGSASVACAGHCYKMEADATGRSF